MIHLHGFHKSYKLETPIYDETHDIQSLVKNPRSDIMLPFEKGSKQFHPERFRNAVRREPPKPSSVSLLLGHPLAFGLVVTSPHYGKECLVFVIAGLKFFRERFRLRLGGQNN